MENMNRREFLKKTAGIAGVGTVAGFGGSKIEKMTSTQLPDAGATIRSGRVEQVPNTPSPEVDPLYNTYLFHIYAGNQDAILAGLQMAQKFQEGITSNKESIEALKNLILIASPEKQVAYKMSLRSLEERIDTLQLEVKKFADPIEDYYKIHPDAPVPKLPETQAPQYLPDEVEKGRMSYS